VLTYGVPPNTDYIHANWVDSNTVKLTNKFICAQGPIDSSATSPGTVNDFWRMVWQEKVRFIVMLCNVIETGKVKCAQYFPVLIEESKTYGTITVKNLKNVTAPNEKVRFFMSNFISDCLDLRVFSTRSKRRRPERTSSANYSYEVERLARLRCKCLRLSDDENSKDNSRCSKYDSSDSL
jgi:protein tyrosine phosphatase